MLLPLFFRLHYEGMTPDCRLHLFCESYKELMRAITSIDDTGRHETLQILETTYDASELQTRRNKTHSLDLNAENSSDYVNSKGERTKSKFKRIVSAS